MRHDPDEIRAAQAEGSRMDGECEPWHLPHMAAHTWPWLEHSRPGTLTEAELDRHIAEMHPSPAPRIPRPHVAPSLLVVQPIRKPGRIRLALRRAWRWLMAPRCAL